MFTRYREVAFYKELFTRPKAVVGFFAAVLVALRSSFLAALGP